MGFRVERGFALAFAAGLLFVGIFAWKRFNEKTFDTKSFSYKVLTELDLTALRGGAAMRRAYMIYAGTLIGLYVAMTFFGKLILETVGRLPIAGAQVDVSGLNFNSPQWPLLLAFGFAGLAPMIKPLELCETWLRSRAHQAVGIPTRIDQLARRLIDNFERQYRAHTTPAKRKSGNGRAGSSGSRPQTPEWVRTHLGSDAVVARINSVYDELYRFKEWSEEEDPDWPNRSVRGELRRLEREVAAEASAALQEYDDVLHQKYDLPSAAGAAAETPEQAQARRKRLRLRLDAAVQRMSELRGDLAAIIAVYAEGDQDFSKIVKPEHQNLRKALSATFSFMRVRSGPEIALLVTVLPVFLIYVVGCLLDLHPLLKPVQMTPVTVLVTAGAETLRFASLLTMPAIVAFALRFYLLDQASGNRHETDAAPPALTQVQRLAATALGVLVSAILLGLVAMLWAAILSRNSVGFQGLLFSGGFLMYFVSQVWIAALVLYCALAACDMVTSRAAADRRAVGIACALLIFAGLLAYFSVWYNGLRCGDAPFAIGMFTDRVCFRDNTGLDYLIYPVIAFLTCAVFGTMPGGEPARPSGTQPVPALGAGAFTVGAAVLILMLSVVQSRASGPGSGAPPKQTGDVAAEAICGKPPNEETCDITIGFRNDAEPFSFLVESDGQETYHGYLADLCYALFHGSAYRLTSVAVTVANRFDKIRNGEVHLLCDPVTLRFSDPSREVNGFYSPIVFASGVTYLQRKAQIEWINGGAVLGYAKKSTAEKVAKKACEVDLFLVREPGVGPADGECETDDAPACSGAVPNARGYKLCREEEHSSLIRWFCSPDDETYHRVYVGDREIIRGKLAAYLKQDHTCPEARVEVGQSNFTYEPYALVVNGKRPELAQFVQRKVYEYFSHPGNARGLFTKHFPGQQMSPALAYLYLLNGVMEREPFTFATKEDVPETPPPAAPASGGVPQAAPAPVPGEGLSFGRRFLAEPGVEMLSFAPPFVAEPSRR
jgi:hypothetical protein